MNPMGLGTYCPSFLRLKGSEKITENCHSLTGIPWLCHVTNFISIFLKFCFTLKKHRKHSLKDHPDGASGVTQ